MTIAPLARETVCDKEEDEDDGDEEEKAENANNELARFKNDS